MNTIRITVLACFLFLCLAGVSGCGEKTETSEQTTGKTATEEPEITKADGSYSYMNEEVVFGVYFDEKGTKRTIDLGRGDNEFDVFIIVHFPEEMQIAATEFKLTLPEGVSIVNDKYNMNRTLSMGTFEHGLAERFPCTPGPMLLIHTLTLQAETPLENASIGLAPSENGEFIGVAECEENYPRARARAYRAVINPTE